MVIPCWRAGAWLDRRQNHSFPWSARPQPVLPASAHHRRNHRNQRHPSLAVGKAWHRPHPSARPTVAAREQRENRRRQAPPAGQGLGAHGPRVSLHGAVSGGHPAKEGRVRPCPRWGLAGLAEGAPAAPSTHRNHPRHYLGLEAVEARSGRECPGPVSDHARNGRRRRADPHRRRRISPFPCCRDPPFGPIARYRRKISGAKIDESRRKRKINLTRVPSKRHYL